MSGSPQATVLLGPVQQSALYCDKNPVGILLFLHVWCGNVIFVIIVLNMAIVCVIKHCTCHFLLHEKKKSKKICNFVFCLL